MSVYSNVRDFLIYNVPRMCPNCEKFRRGVIKRKINTGFINDELNYSTQCEPCHNTEQYFWSSIWGDYEED